MKFAFDGAVGLLCVAFVAVFGIEATAQRPVVPGTGKWIDYVGDDFENADWNFVHNHPKSSRENDEQLRAPTGRSTNDRWFEGPERGQPDYMKVVEAPAGALPGSENALLVRTLKSGVPGYINRQVEQDDLVINVVRRLNGTIPVSETPNFVVRVYLPPWEEWENRSGPHFGIRGTATSHVTKAREQEYTSGGLFRRSTRTRMVTSNEVEPYWPGMWIHFRNKGDKNTPVDSAYLKVRGNNRGHDFKVRELEEPGWWTFGMSFTGDGKVHYYARRGVEELTADDYLTSQYPYSYRAERFETFFFNIVNRNDGRTWSTPFLIDDPRLYVVNSRRIENIVQNKRDREERQAQARSRKTASRKGNARN